MHWRIRNPLLKPLMGAGLVEIENILIKEAMELLLMQDQEVIQAFSSHASQKAFADSIGLWSSVGCAKHFDATCGRHTRKIRPEFAVIIPQQIAWGLPIWSCFSQLLRDPGIGGRSGHIHMDDLPRFQFDDEESKQANGRRDQGPVRKSQAHTSAA